MNETLVRSGGRNVLRVERRVAHPPEKVWRAVTEPAELSAWFPSPVELDELRAGAEIRFVGDGFGSAGTIAEVDPPRVFAFDWEGELLRFELAPDGDAGCLLVFTHTFDDRAGAASFAAGWDACLDALDGLLDGIDPPAQPPEMSAAHEAFVRRFGLDEGALEETTDGGWRIRFERQLTRHAPDAWPLMSAAASADGEWPTTVDEPRLLETEHDGGASP
ncbi:SRPBCC family protein [Conexibacter woesei]|uniref:Activator of Hsp90 ATPase 1 family protein n=1 Tax=Conexibacter woesei (strain DSM 14684 / CCUG 47730 / CIP 108061 / JCM 11494 / NBRC 100937 / ID131577) TaxID=469383 RepID=D3EZ38_CONWI|nr:SRPBCC family protein [Conexibacter woesei]ADB51803.1 Activator of Hsp90 ATPase 1 family protein [Conexibacter woesei DSM 14684]